MRCVLTCVLAGLSLVLLVDGPLVFAAISVSNDALRPASPDGHNITTDSATGLDWLDPTATTNKSFDDMTTLLGTTPFAGFRHATRLELQAFLNHLGLPLANLGGPFGLLFDGGAAYEQAATIIGITQLTPHSIHLTGGMTADTIPGESGHVMAYTGHSTDGYSFVSLLDSVYTDDRVQTNIGHWLVRETSAVPEPASLAIWLVIAIAATGVHFRKIGS